MCPLFTPGKPQVATSQLCLVNIPLFFAFAVVAAVNVATDAVVANGEIPCSKHSRI